MNEKVYGIDLGTTYSAVALVGDLGQAEIMKNFDGQDTTPSVVLFDDDGTVTVGSQAKQAQLSDPDKACSLIKRHMGEDFQLEFNGTAHTPESVSALILKELVNNANSQNGLAISKAVITVPAYFGIQERQATRQAGEMAGLEVVGIIPEPVAAAITLGTQQEEELTFLIFDLGGGTFDTTILKAKAGTVEVVAIDGNRLLGGADWDERLEAVMLEKFVAQAGLGDDVDPSTDDEFMAGLRLRVEDVKKSLTMRPSTPQLLQFGATKVKIEISREEFEQATTDLVAQTVEITRRVLATATGKEPGLTIDKLLLVGGSSRMPMIKAALQAEGFEPQDTDFDLSVAKGAAIFGQGELPAFEFGDTATADGAPDGANVGENGNRLPGIGPAGGVDTRRTVVTNVLSRGLGVQMVREGADGELEEYVEFLAHSQATLPLTASTQGGIIRDGQNTIQVDLFEQGGEVESDDPSANKAMASGESTTISGLPYLTKGSPVDVNLEVSSEGTVVLVVVEPQSGKSFRAEAAVSVLSQEDVKKYTEIVNGIMTRS